MPFKYNESRNHHFKKQATHIQGHAFGLRPTKFPITDWPQLVKTWLTSIRMISRN